MTDELWRHALNTLECYKYETDISELYKYDDGTGILEKHKKVLSTDNGRIPELKTMYFELIKMLLDYERSHCDQEAFKKVKEVTKIQGYQELTNRLLRNINDRLVHDLELVNDKLDKLERFVGLTSDGEEEEEEESVQDDERKKQRHRKPFKMRLRDLESEVGHLSGDNNRTKEELEDLQHKLKSKDEVDSDVKQAQELQLETLLTFEKRLDSNEEHIELLEKHDMDQDETISSMQGKVDALEKADTFLQGIHEEAARKAQSIEESLQMHLSQDYKVLEEDFKEHCDAKAIDDDKFASLVEKLVSKEGQLDRAVETLKGNQEESNLQIQKLENELHDVNVTSTNNANDINQIEERIEKIEPKTTKLIDGVQEKLDGSLTKIEDQGRKLEGIYMLVQDNQKMLEEESKATSAHGDVIYSLESSTSKLKNDVSELKSSLIATEDKLSKEIAIAEGRVEKAEDQQKLQEDKIFGLMEKHVEQLEKATFVDKLQSQLCAMDEQKQQSEAKFKEEMDSTVMENKKSFEEIKDLMEKKLICLENTAAQNAAKVAPVEQLCFDVDKLKAAHSGTVEQLGQLEPLAHANETSIMHLQDQHQIHDKTIINLTEKQVEQFEKAVFVEKLQTQVYTMNAEKEQSEARLKDEMDNTVMENKRSLEEIKDFVTVRLRELQNIADEHTTMLEPINQIQVDVGDIRDASYGTSNRLAVLEPIAMENEKSIKFLEEDVKEMPKIVKDSVMEHTTNMKCIIDDKIVQLNIANEENGKHVDNLRDLNTKLMEDLRNQLKDDIADQNKHLKEMRDESTDEIDSINYKIKDILEVVGDFDIKEFNDLVKAREDFKDKINHLEREVFESKAMKDDIDVMVHEVKDKSEKAVKELEGKVQDKFAEIQEHDLDAIRTVVANLKEDTAKNESDLTNVTVLVENVQNDFGDVASECSLAKNQLLQIQKEMDGNQRDVWRLLLEVYGALRGYTVVLRSSGPAATCQPSCLGVYRMVDSTNGKPVYKQDNGENYLYFNKEKSSWMVGTNVGDSYAWIKNDCGESPSDSASENDSDSSLGSDGFAATRSMKKRRFEGRDAHFSPDLLESGWKYKPDPLELASITDGTLWREDDHTLRVEALKDIKIIGDVIRDIRNAKEVD